jgi:hypothetical protein
MAVTLISQVTKRYTGLSTDSKPTGTSQAAGSLFYVTDTKAVFIYDGAAWVDATGYVLFSIR